MNHRNKRQLGILDILSKEDVVSSKALAQLLQVSSKTIQHEIKEINTLFNAPCILSIKGRGYRLILNSEVISFLEGDIPLSRNFTVLKELLYADKINFYDLAERLFISEANLQKCILELNQIITQRHIPICIKRQLSNVYLDGTEEARRQAITYCLMHEINEYDFDLKNYSDFFQKVNVSRLKKYILDFNQTHDIKMKDFEVLSFILHVAMMIERVLQGNEVLELEGVSMSREHEQLVLHFYDGLKKIVDINLSSKELSYLLCLFSGKLSVQSENINRMGEIVDSLLKKIKKQYDIDITEDENLKTNLLFHLIGLENRIKSQTFLNNPLIGDIKKHFPIVYDMSVFIALNIQEQFQVNLYEDEIGYITLHLLGSLEHLNQLNKRRVIVLSPMGKAANAYLRNKLANIRELNVEVSAILSIFDIDKIKEYQPDLVISFLNTPRNFDLPVYCCDHLLKAEDIEKIYHLLKGTVEDRKGEQFFQEDLFFVDQEFQNRSDCIQSLCKKLEEKGFVDQGYKELVLLREKIAPTTYGNLFAIPHPIEKTAKENRVVICTLKKPIPWGKQKVQLIFLFSVSNKKDVNFDKLFESLVALFDDEGKVRRLIKEKNFDLFLERFFG